MHHDQAISSSYCGETVCDKEHRAIGKIVEKIVTESAFGFVIKGACGFIHDQHTASVKEGAGQGDTPAVSLLPAAQVDSLQVAFSLLVECCLPEEPRHLRTSSIFKSLKQIRGIERWCGASGSLIVVDLACRGGLVQAVRVRAGREIVWADPGSLRFEVNALRYQQGGQNVAPDVKLHSREALELIHPALFADAAKVLEDHRSGAVLVTKVTPEQIAVRSLDYWDTTDLIIV